MRWSWISILILASACRTPATAPAAFEPNDQVVRMLDTPAAFHGSRGAAVDPAELGEVRIGFFAPADTLDPLAGPMYRAATLAIEHANADGGYEGVPFRLVPRWDEDPWRGGSREVTRLVYRDSVWAVIGSVDGEATHIAEQITSKTWVPLLSPVSADPTLTHINVPWIFRLPADGTAQARALADEIGGMAAPGRVGLVTSTDHDGRVFAGEVTPLLNGAPLFHLEVDAADIDASELASRVGAFAPDALVVRLPRPDVPFVASALREHGVRVPMLLPWIPGADVAEIAHAYGSRVCTVQPFEAPDERALSAMRASYQSRFGAEPTPAAVLTYDTTRLLLAALSRSGLNRAALRDEIWHQSGFAGLSGEVRWDNGGGNTGARAAVSCLSGQRR